MADSRLKSTIALAMLFLAAHLPFLPPSLEDIDSINFALGVRHFDVGRHQPHPPGYPVFIGLAKLSTPVLRAAGVPAPEVRGLAVWSAVSGAALVLLLLALYGTWDPAGGAAAVATLVAVTSPLFWFTALRPLSDTTGLAATVAAQALLCGVAVNRAGARALLAGAFIAGLAIGVRSQTFLLTLPLLALVLAWPGTKLRMRDRALAVAAAAAGGLAWGVPLVAASGGLDDYLAALGTQAGEDFSGVVMLWNMRQARVLLDALLHSFLWPWGSPAIGAVVLALAALGFVRAAWRLPRVVVLLVFAFGPYAIFHLLFHEVVTVRYALPLVVPVAWLVASALAALPRVAGPVTAAAMAAVFLSMAVPASAKYGGSPSPATAALLAADAQAPEGDSTRAVIAMHAVTRRTAEWLAPGLRHRVLKAPHGREWLTLVDQWRSNPDSRVMFVADPRRTDLALFDWTARAAEPQRFRWGFAEPPFVGGARPGDSDLHALSPPGWMLERGWALTAEVAGVTSRENRGPHRAPAVAWVRARDAEAVLVIGGRHIAGGDRPVHLAIDAGGRPLASLHPPPGFFFGVVEVPAGALGGTEYVPLEVRATADAGSPVPEVKLEQFDLQSGATPMVGLDGGWHEPEYNPLTARSWRWMTERGGMWVRPVGRDVTLTLAGESPLRYFEAAPTVRVSIGDREVARFAPSSDFSQAIVLPAAALAAAGGRIVIESDTWFVPGERAGSADRRHLALRVYSWTVR